MNPLPKIQYNDVEVWEVYNTTADAHPIHLHLVSFQILDRRPFEGEVEEKPPADARWKLCTWW
ncbi:MAG: multicopper oxidase domain-containing protein [Calditrichia bacterium]